MALNKSKGNMYSFITHTWNTIKGQCPHDCSYCYMKRWGKLNKVRFDKKELKTDLGVGNYIFVGSSCDMFAEGIDGEWIMKTLWRIKEYEQENKFFFQSKNTSAFKDFVSYFPYRTSLCTTIETNRKYIPIMKNCPMPFSRAAWMADDSILHNNKIKRYLTIEPIMKFDIKEFLEIIEMCNPKQINIGADSGNHNLPEPSKEELQELLAKLNEMKYLVHQKDNLKRLLL